MIDPSVSVSPFTTITLKPGNHYWCTCGQSRNYPFWNGAVLMGDRSR